MVVTGTPLKKVRWRWRYVLKQTRRHARSWIVGAPGSSRASRSIWICSWQRSGSTWLAEMLCEPRGTRLVYEPANLADRAFDGVRAAAMDLPSEGGPASSDVIAALYGTIRGTWIDQHNHAHVVRRRVVKDVRALALAGEVHAKVPEAPMIVLVRHPIAVARSVRELGWIDHDDLEHAFEHEVTRWCHAHAHAFADERLSDVHFVDYATLRENPTEQLASIVAYASARDRTWRSLKVGRIDVERSSSTNFRGTTTSKESAHTWHGVSDSLIEFALTTLDAHGLSAIYGVNARALCDLNEFAQACRLRRG